jgi:hypothetical protein
LVGARIILFTDFPIIKALLPFYNFISLVYLILIEFTKTLLFLGEGVDLHLTGALWQMLG